MLIPAASATRTTRIHRSFTVKTAATPIVAHNTSRAVIFTLTGIPAPRCEKKKRGGGEKRQYDPCKT
jgi:hypothetical protein